MATGTEQAQTTVPTCTDHKHQLLLSYCRTCHKRICEHCVKGPHSEHDWTFLQNHVRQVRDEGQKIAKEIRDEILAFLKEKRNETAKEQEKAEIRRRQQDLKDLIDEYSDEMVSHIDEEDVISDVDKEIEEFERWAIFFEKNVRTEYDSVVVEMEEEYNDKLRQHKASKAAVQARTPTFQKGTVDKDKVKEMMGCVEIVNMSRFDVTVLNTLKHGEHRILSIEAMSEDKAWIHSSSTNYTSLMDIDGTELHTKGFNTRFSDFLVNGNDQIYTKFNGNYVAVLSSGRVKEICTTSLHPYGVCHSQEGGMLVCLTDTYVEEATLSSKGEIHHMDMTGTLKKRYHLNVKDNMKLLTCPYRVAQNINYDLCVCDIMEANQMGKLVVFNNESRMRFTYQGQLSLKGSFCPRDVECDSVGRIFLCDTFNSAVHMLSIDGQFIQLLLSSVDGSCPRAISLYGTTMWVGYYDGVIKVCKLKQEGS